MKKKDPSDETIPRVTSFESQETLPGSAEVRWSFSREPENGGPDFPSSLTKAVVLYGVSSTGGTAQHTPLMLLKTPGGTPSVPQKRKEGHTYSWRGVVKGGSYITFSPNMQVPWERGKVPSLKFLTKSIIHRRSSETQKVRSTFLEVLFAFLLDL